MTITAAMIKAYKSGLISFSTPAANGGRISATPSVDNTDGNVWPEVTDTDRQTGRVVRAKLCHRIESPSDEALASAVAYVSALETGVYWSVIRPGSHTDTEDQLGATRCYGIATLTAAVAEGATSLSLALEHADATAQAPFAAGDAIRLIASDGSGSRETRRVAAAGVTYGANGALTVTLAVGVTRAWAAGTLVASLWEVGTVAPLVAALQSNGSGTIDGTKLVPRSIGGITQLWTLTFTSAQAYTVSGDTVGAVGTGSIGADFSPLNPATSTPYFTLPSPAWGGTWAAGHWVTFWTYPPAIPLWWEHHIPANAPEEAVLLATVTVGR